MNIEWSSNPEGSTLVSFQEIEIVELETRISTFLGQKKNSCPGVPLSRDKGRSKCPGTKHSVPGRPGTK